MLLSSPLFSCPVTLLPSPSLFSTDTLAALFRIILPPKPALPICGQKKLNTEAIGNHGNLATSVNLNTPCYQGATFSPSISRVPYLVSTPLPSHLFLARPQRIFKARSGLDTPANQFQFPLGDQEKALPYVYFGNVAATTSLYQL